MKAMGPCPQGCGSIVAVADLCPLCVPVCRRCEQLRAELTRANERAMAWRGKAAVHAKVVQEFRETCEAKGAENVRLREWNREQAAENDDLSNAAHEVRAENARLREQVKTLSYVACAECGCAKCDEGEELDYCECST